MINWLERIIDFEELLFEAKGLQSQCTRLVAERDGLRKELTLVTMQRDKAWEEIV